MSSIVAAGPADALAALSAAAPSGVSVLAVPERGTPGAGELLRDVEFLVLDHDRTDILPALRALPLLRVVQSLIVGTDWVRPHLPDGVMLSRPVGVRDNGVAEWVCSALLGLASGLLPAVRDQHRRSWCRAMSSELAGSRVVVLGAGSIGLATRDLLVRLGVEVVLVARHRREGVRAVTELGELVAEADALVVLVPVTPETAGLVDAAVLRSMRDGAVLVNAARGQIVDHDALTAEVTNGRLLAVLDVTDPEPLPDDHPLWDAAGCFVSPHIAGATVQGRRRAIEFAARHLAQYASRKPVCS
jgi:phosphoglycerate dehydrogenase-like enzyme